MITPGAHWTFSLGLARSCQDSEIERRHATDSLYFAVFLAVRARLGARRTSNPDGSHIAVIEQLKLVDGSHRRAGSRLESLRRLRNRAKYEVDFDFATTELDEAIRHAEAVRKLLGLE